MNRFIAEDILKTVRSRNLNSLFGLNKRVIVSPVKYVEYEKRLSKDKNRNMAKEVQFNVYNIPDVAVDSVVNYFYHREDKFLRVYTRSMKSSVDSRTKTHRIVVVSIPLN